MHVVCAPIASNWLQGKVRRTKHLCYHVNLFFLFFFSGENKQYAILPCKEKSTNIQKNVHVYFSLQMM